MKNADAIRQAIVKWMAIGAAVSFVPFWFISLLAYSGAAMAPQPDPKLGHTVFLTATLNHGGRASGYVKPWIAEAYHWVHPAFLIYIAALVAVLIGLALWRKLETAAAPQTAESEKQ